MRRAREKLVKASGAAFVVRIWLERREMEGAEPLWRGEIEDAQSGERKYFAELAAVERFISDHLRRLGVDARGQKRSLGLRGLILSLILRRRRRAP